MKTRNLFLASLLALILIVVLTVGGLLWLNATRMLPAHAGIRYVSGLGDTVEIIRDARGVPHIYASTPADLFFAQGYTHAQDRWWQMEFQRHTGQGRIQELTGYNLSALGSDLFIRTWGWNRAAAGDTAALGQATQTVLDAYSAGVNAYIGGKHGGELALEYTLLGLTGVHIPIEPWTPLDTAAWAKVMAWDLGGNANYEYQRMLLAEELSLEMLADLFPDYPFDARPTILTAADLPLSGDSLRASGAAPALAAVSPPPTLAGGTAAMALLPPQGAGIGSNNWVISGSNTASGQPILANDPHLGIQMPSIWYQVGLHCRPVTVDCPYDVVGFGFAGAPGVVVGHNQHIAWGVTNHGPDVQDLYVIRVNPDDPFQYEYNGEWREMEVVTEVIRAGTAFSSAEDDPATPACEGISGLPLDADGNLAITVRVTHFGPIISDNQITEDCRFVGLTESEGDDPLALRWTGLEPGDLLGAIIALNSASDWESFRTALSGWDWPSQNFVYADTAGNIGYQAPGRMPLRAADHTGQMPVPGWTDAYEWQGYISYDDLPRSLNPERGWIVTANNAVAPPEYYAALEETLGQNVNAVYQRRWAEGYRAARIEEMVAAVGAHTLQTVAAIQGDAHSIVAEELLPYLLDLDLEDKTLADHVAWLVAWDLQARADSPRAALFEAFWAALVERLWADTLGYPGGGAWATQRLLADPENAWWDDPRTPAVETRDTILALALEDALATLSERLGPERENWRWGDLHTATFVSTPLGQSGIAAIEGLVNAGPVPASGSTHTVNATGWSASTPFEVQSLPSFRMIVDLRDFEASLGVHTTGQSGHPLSPHYADMIDAWRAINYYPLHFGEEAVQSAMASRLVLRPAVF